MEHKEGTTSRPRFRVVDRRSPTLHDFPYRGEGRKCYHKWIVNVTPPGKAHCLHACLYCYARDAVYARSDEMPVVYGNLARMVERELERLELCPPVSISNITDPCQDAPEVRKAVCGLVEVLCRWGVSFHIITKGDPSFLSEAAGFPGKGRFFLEVTVEGPPEVLCILSPRAPDYHARLQSLRWAKGLGLPALVRVDPVIPPLWRAVYGPGWMDAFRQVLRDAASAGATHAVCSTGRFTSATRKTLARAIAPFSAHEARSMLSDYAFDRSQTSSGYMLLLDHRLSFHLEARTAAEEAGMTYAVCQELPAAAADTPGLPHCEAFPMPFSRRSGSREFVPIPGCTANCHSTCPDPASPPCGRSELARPQPFTPTLLKKGSGLEF